MNTPTNAFATIAASNAARMSGKAKAISEAKQRLAEASDLYAGGDETKSEAQSVASTAMNTLYQARINGLASAAEVTTLIGDVFGFRAKGDSKRRVKGGTKDASATPFGVGAEIQKRINRAVSAHDYASGGEPSTYFEDIPAEIVTEMVANVEQGETSLWALYNDLSAVKRDLNDTTPLHLSAERIAKLVEKLEEPVAVVAISDDPELRAAYASLWSLLGNIGTAIASMETKVSKAKAKPATVSEDETVSEAA